jgi:hypothetical protein
LPALAGIAPVALRHCALQRPLDVRGGAQAKQIRQSLLLGPRHHPFVAPFGIATQQARPALAPELRQQRPQPGGGVLGIVLIAGTHLNPQHQSQIRQHVGVIAMRRPPRFARIVADHRALLMAVERLDRGIDIENPRLGEQRPDAIIEMRLHHCTPAVSSIFASACRSASSLTTLLMPSSVGLTASQRNAVTCA